MPRSRKVRRSYWYLWVYDFDRQTHAALYTNRRQFNRGHRLMTLFPEEVYRRPFAPLLNGMGGYRILLTARSGKAVKPGQIGVRRWKHGTWAIEDCQGPIYASTGLWCGTGKAVITRLPAGVTKGVITLTLVSRFDDVPDETY